MAPPLDIPAWATWGALAALAFLAALVAAVGAKLRVASDRMDLMSHIEELRRRLIRIVLALCAGVGIAFVVRLEPQFPYLGLDPYDNLAAQLFRRMATDLVPPDVRLIVTAPADGFVALFQVALGIGVVVTLPYVLAQVGGFAWPALRPRERRLLAVALVPATALFAVGVAFAYTVLLPPALRALYAFSGSLGADGLLAVGEFVAFTVMLLLLAGISFLTPLAMYAVARIGLATPATFLRKWRHAVVAILIVSAIVTPDPTPVSQILLAVPLVGLYFLGVGLAAVGARKA